MDHDAKSKFILALHKHSLQAFADGGTVLGGPGQNSINQNAVNPNTGIGGAIGGLLGVNNNFQAGAANIQAGTNTAQLNNAYSGAQAGLQGQQAFTNAAAAQNGFGNQANVFAQQQALSDQLQRQANGEGPNVALSQLNQATGQNVANQGALMAGQRGAGSNPALLAKLAAQQGAATQQQAVGQGATLQAQQQIAAQAALANQQAQMQGVAANQINNYGQGVQGYNAASQGEQGILQNANTAYNNAGVSMQANINNVNAQTAAENQKTNSGIVGGLLGSAGLAGFKSKMAEGGMVPSAKSFANHSMDEHLHAAAKAYHPHMYAEGGGVNPPMPVELPKPEMPKDEEESSGPDPAQLASIAAVALASKGGKIKPTEPGQEATKKGNSYANDKIPALLSSGEIVLPRSVTMHAKAPEKAAEFVRAVMAKKQAGGKR